MFPPSTASPFTLGSTNSQPTYPQNGQHPDDLSESGQKTGSTRWRWNPARDLAMLELVKEHGVTNLRFGRSSGAPTWVPICDGLLKHPSAPNRDVKPTARTVQTRYIELMERFRDQKSNSAKLGQTFVPTTRVDELLNEFEDQTAGTTAAAPLLSTTPGSHASVESRNRAVKRSLDSGTDDDESSNLPFIPSPTISHPSANMRPNPFDLNNTNPPSLFSTPSTTAAKRVKTDPALRSGLNLSVYNPPRAVPTLGQTDSNFWLQQLVAQNNRLIETLDTNNKNLEARDRAHVANEEKMLFLLQGMRDEMRQIYDKMVVLMDRTGAPIQPRAVQ